MNYQMSARNNFLNGLENQKSGLEKELHIGRFCWQPSDPFKISGYCCKKVWEQILVD